MKKRKYKKRKLLADPLKYPRASKIDNSLDKKFGASAKWTGRWTNSY